MRRSMRRMEQMSDPMRRLVGSGKGKGIGFDGMIIALSAIAAARTSKVAKRLTQVTLA